MAIFVKSISYERQLLLFDVIAFFYFLFFWWRAPYHVIKFSFSGWLTMLWGMTLRILCGKNFDLQEIFWAFSAQTLPPTLLL